MRRALFKQKLKKFFYPFGMNLFYRNGSFTWNGDANILGFIFFDGFSLEVESVSVCHHSSDVTEQSHPSILDILRPVFKTFSMLKTMRHTFYHRLMITYFWSLYPIDGVCPLISISQISLPTKRYFDPKVASTASIS